MGAKDFQTIKILQGIIKEGGPITIGDVLHAKRLQAEKEKQEACKQANIQPNDKQPVE